MKIKRFNESVKHSDYVKELIDKFKWNETHTRYIIASPKDKVYDIMQKSGYLFLEQADKQLMSNRNLWRSDDFSECIFEVKVKIMKPEEIELELDAKKYNL